MIVIVSLIDLIYSTMFYTDFPTVIMDIERVELEIACGLQDRVVQTYGGLVTWTLHRLIMSTL